MNKRYQVFVSSTYTDLRDERDKVYKTLMAMGCIPAGMECFAAESAEQLETIKRVINDSDFYLLILAGRYGTVASDGRSFTEKEFDYALLLKKPILVFCHQSPQKLSQEKADLEPATRESLQTFRAKALSDRMAAFWTSADELSTQVALALYHAIETIPAAGWVRATQPSQKEPIAVQVPETADLKEPSPRKAIAKFTNTYSAKELSDKVCRLFGTYGLDEEWSLDLTWDNVFAYIASYIVVERAESSVSTHIATRALECEGVKKSNRHPYLNHPYAKLTAAFMFPPAIVIWGLSIGRVDSKAFDTMKKFCTENDLVKIEIKRDSDVGIPYWTLSAKGDLLAAQIKLEKASANRAQPIPG